MGLFDMSLAKLIFIGLVASALLNLFSIGLKASLEDATYLFRRPGELARALLAMNVLMPLFAVALISIFDFNPAVKIALVALSVSPIPPRFPTKIVKAGGTESYAIGLHIAIGLLAIIFVPLAMEIIGRIRNVGLHMSIAPVARVVFITTLIPLAIGIGAHKLAPALAERVAKPITLLLEYWTVSLRRCHLDCGGACHVVTHRQRYRHRTHRICDRWLSNRPLLWRSSTRQAHCAGSFDCFTSPRNRASTGTGKFSSGETRNHGGPFVPARQRSCFDFLSPMD